MTVGSQIQVGAHNREPLGPQEERLAYRRHYRRTLLDLTLSGSRRLLVNRCLGAVTDPRSLREGAVRLTGSAIGRSPAVPEPLSS